MDLEMHTLAGQPVLLLFKHNILVAAHRDTGDALRIRPSLPGWLGAVELLPAQRELRIALEFVDGFLHFLLF